MSVPGQERPTATGCCRASTGPQGTVHTADLEWPDVAPHSRSTSLCTASSTAGEQAAWLEVDGEMHGYVALELGHALNAHGALRAAVLGAL
jgi:hypothetical protein